LQWIGECIALEWGIGETRNIQEKKEHGIRCAVYFEKKGAKSALVKPENLCIAFELPDEVV
jgi:hypothetical protein